MRRAQARGFCLSCHIEITLHVGFSDLPEPVMSGKIAQKPSPQSLMLAEMRGAVSGG